MPDAACARDDLRVAAAAERWLTISFVFFIQERRWAGAWQSSAVSRRKLDYGWSTANAKESGSYADRVKGQIRPVNAHFDPHCSRTEQSEADSEKNGLVRGVAAKPAAASSGHDKCFGHHTAGAYIVDTWRTRTAHLIGAAREPSPNRPRLEEPKPRAHHGHNGERGEMNGIKPLPAIRCAEAKAHAHNVPHSIESGSLAHVASVVSGLVNRRHAMSDGAAAAARCCVALLYNSCAGSVCASV